MFSIRLQQKLNAPIQDEYDYIIVGAGACGCVVAARLLAECPDATIALIEAGGFHQANYGNFIQNMAGYGTQNDYHDAVTDHLFNQPRAAIYHRGIGLGGSTITNGAVWVDTRVDIRRWAAEFKLSSWTNSLDEHYRALTSLLTPSSQFGRASAIGQAMHSAFRQNFFQPDGEHHGVRFAESVMDNGKRRDVFTTLLSNYLDDPRFTVCYQSPVQQIHFTREDDKLTANAVSFKRDNQVQTLRAKHKIILTAGTVATPALLQASGIGPRGSLLRLPVGDHLKVHHMVMLAAPLVTPIEGHHATNMDVSVLTCGLRDFDQHTAEHHTRFKVQTFIQRDMDMKPVNVVIGCFPFQHFSEGSVRHNPADAAHPTIHSSVSADIRDQALLLEALLLADKMMNLLHQQNIVKYTRPFTDDNACEFVANNYLVDPHFISTCRVGDVVDEQFAVKNCDHLMIADASVLPEQTSGNCISAAMMIARVAADVVKQDWLSHRTARALTT